MRDRLLPRVLTGLKERLLTADLVEEFVRVFVREVNAANQARGARQSRVVQDRSKLERQIRNMLELIKDGHGSGAMVQELRAMEQQLEATNAALAADRLPEPAPMMHPNPPQLYRRKVEALELALKDPSIAMLAAEALRTLVDAIAHLLRYWRCAAPPTAKAPAMIPRLWRYKSRWLRGHAIPYVEQPSFGHNG